MNPLADWSEKACSVLPQPRVIGHFNFHSLQIAVDRPKYRIYGKRGMGDNVKPLDCVYFQNDETCRLSILSLSP